MGYFEFPQWRIPLLLLFSTTLLHFVTGQQGGQQQQQKQSWMDNNLIGPSCSGIPLTYSNIPEYPNAVTACDKEESHCRPLCIISRLGMMDTKGYFKPGSAKPVIEKLFPQVRPPIAFELEGAFESCSVSFNFNEPMSAKRGCVSYSPLLDCFRKSTLMICEGVNAEEIRPDIGDASTPWPEQFRKMSLPPLTLQQGPNYGISGPTNQIVPPTAGNRNTQQQQQPYAAAPFPGNVPYRGQQIQATNYPQQYGQQQQQQGLSTPGTGQGQYAPPQQSQRLYLRRPLSMSGANTNPPPSSSSSSSASPPATTYQNYQRPQQQQLPQQGYQNAPYNSYYFPGQQQYRQQGQLIQPQQQNRQYGSLYQPSPYPMTTTGQGQPMTGYRVYQPYYQPSQNYYGGAGAGPGTPYNNPRQQQVGLNYNGYYPALYQQNGQGLSPPPSNGQLPRLQNYQGNMPMMQSVPRSYAPQIQNQQQQQQQPDVSGIQQMQSSLPDIPKGPPAAADGMTIGGQSQQGQSAPTPDSPSPNQPSPSSDALGAVLPNKGNAYGS